MVHDDKEILVPVDGRSTLVETLHGTHMATDTMVRAAKGKFMWPGLKKDLHAKYRGCSECLLFSKDKIDKSDQVPESLLNLYPGEKLSVDFFEIHRKDIFVVVDHVSSHLFARITPDKTFGSAKACMEEYFHTYSLAYTIQSNNSPAFRNAWQ